MQTPTRPERPIDADSELSGARNRVPMAPAPTPKKKTPVWIPIALVAALLGAGLFIKGRMGKQADTTRQNTAPSARTVRVVPVTTGTIVSNITITGQLRSNQNVNLSSKISGLVSAVYVTEGQKVSRGQLLVALDDADLRQQVEANRAAVETARVRLQQTQLNLPSRVAQLQSAVDQAQAQLQNADAAVRSANARYQQALLQEPSTITTTQSQLDAARAGVRAAQAAAKQARDTARQTQGSVNAAIASAEAALAQGRAQLEQVKNGSRTQQIAQAQAQVALTEAQVNQAKAQLADADANLKRQQTLFAGGATAQANVQTAQTQYNVAQSQLGVAQAQLEAQKQNLSLIREGSRTEEVRAAEEVVNQREAAVQSARADQNRVLAAQSAVTQALAQVASAQEQERQAIAGLSGIPVVRQETRAALEALNQARAQDNLQRAALRQARVNLSQAPGFRADVPAARAALSQAQATLQQSIVNLGYARIYSPVNGVVSTKGTDVGQSAGPGTTLLNLVALDNVVFEAQIPESQLSQIQVGQPARVTVTAVSNAPIIGYVQEIIPVADDRLRQFRVRISLPQSDRLTPGAFARGILQTQVITNTLTVPDEVVHTETDNPYVYVAVPSGDTSVVKKRTVKVGASAAGKTQILGGVNKGDKIISGNATFEDNDKVITSQGDESASGGRVGASSSTDTTDSTGTTGEGSNPTSSGSTGGGSNSSEATGSAASSDTSGGASSSGGASGSGR